MYVHVLIYQICDVIFYVLIMHSYLTENLVLSSTSFLIILSEEIWIYGHPYFDFWDKQSGRNFSAEKIESVPPICETIEFIKEVKQTHLDHNNGFQGDRTVGKTIG